MQCICFLKYGYHMELSKLLYKQESAWRFLLSQALRNHRNLNSAWLWIWTKRRVKTWTSKELVCVLSLLISCYLIPRLFLLTVCSIWGQQILPAEEEMPEIMDSFKKFHEYGNNFGYSKMYHFYLLLVMKMNNYCVLSLTSIFKLETYMIFYLKGIKLEPIS